MVKNKKIHFLSMLTRPNDDIGSPASCILKLGRKTTEICFDTGSGANAINPNYMKKQNLKIIQKQTILNPIIVQVGNSQNMKIKETALLELQNKNHYDKAWFLIMPQLPLDAIIGTKTASRLDMYWRKGSVFWKNQELPQSQFKIKTTALNTIIGFNPPPIHLAINKQRITLNPEEMKVVQIKTTRKPWSSEAMIRPINRPNALITLAPGLVKINPDGTLNVALVNHTNKRVSIKPNNHIGKLSYITKYDENNTQLFQMGHELNRSKNKKLIKKQNPQSEASTKRFKRFMTKEISRYNSKHNTSVNYFDANLGNKPYTRKLHREKIILNYIENIPLPFSEEREDGDLTPKEVHETLNKKANSEELKECFDDEFIEEDTNDIQQAISKLTTQENNLTKPTCPVDPERQKIYEGFNLKDSSLDNNQRDSIIDMLLEFKDVFDLDKKPNIQHTKSTTCKINTGENLPIRSSYRQTDPVEDRIIFNHIKEMAERGVIQPSKSPWASPILLADKKNGKVRFCIDYRRLNNVTIQDAYPLPKMDEIFKVLGNSSYFSTLDLTDAFWSIPVAEDDRQKTAFTSKYGLWEFTSMPFGLTNAPAIQQRFIESILHGVLWNNCFAYIDDILCFSQTFEDHLQDLKTILSRLQQNNLKMQPPKCAFCKPSFEILGFVATPDGLKPSPKKVEALKNYPEPSTIKETQSFLGIVSWLRRFIPQCSKKTENLRACIKNKPREFKLTPEAKEEMKILQGIMTSNTCLRHPNMSEQFFIHVDASGKGLGAILTQLDKNKRHQVIEYASKTLNNAESKYSNSVREAYGVIWALNHFKYYIYGTRPIVFNDCSCLTQISNSKGTIPEVAALRNWMARLLHFRPRLMHKPGTLMAIPDALSRHFIVYKANTCEPSTPSDTDILGHMIHSACTSAGTLENSLKIQDNLLDRLPAFEDDEFGGTLEVRTLLNIQPAHQQAESADHQDNEKKDIYDSFSSNVIALEQRLDMQLGPLIEYKTTGKTPDTRRSRAHLRRIQHTYLIDSQKILRKIVPLVCENDEYPAVLPRSLWDKVIKAYHDSPISGGHTKREKLVLRLKQKYIFEGMDLYIYTYCKTCSQCQKSTVQKRNTAPLKPIVPSYPGVLVQIDCTNGAGPVTERGNKHILVIIESFSNHIRIFPIEDITAKTIADNLLKYIAIHSMPLKIITDNGPEFSAQIATELSELLGYTHRKISPYNSKANGRVENAHKSIQTMLRAYVEEFQTNWDLLLPFIEFIYNTSPSKSNNGLTPFYLHFGRHPNLPIDVYLGTVDRPTFTTEDYVKEVVRQRNKLLKWIVEYKQKQAEKMKEKYDKAHKNTMTSLKPGDLVRVRNEHFAGPMNKKYNLIYRDLFHVIKNNGDGSFIVEKLNSTEDPEVRNIRSLIKVQRRHELSIDMGKEKITEQIITSDQDQQRSESTTEEQNVQDSEESNLTSDSDQYLHGRWEVESVVNERTFHGVKELQVKWKGWAKKSNSWERQDVLLEDHDNIENLLTKMRERKKKESEKRALQKQKRKEKQKKAQPRKRKRTVEK